MKVVLVHLSGDATRAREVLAGRYDRAEIVSLERAVLESGEFRTRLRALREMRPNIFVIVTESLDWQYGQMALMLFGALAGARESVVIDTRGRIRSATKLALAFSAPPRIAAAYLRGGFGVWRAKKKLARLEREIGGRAPFESPKTTIAASIAYLRATPAPGTQPGGATSHINGVVKGLTAIGARILFISNDDIAGLDQNALTVHKIMPDPDIMPRSAFDITNGMRFSNAAADLVSSAMASFIYQRYVRFSYAGVEASLKSALPLFLEYNGSEVWIGKHWDRIERLDLLERYERLNLAAATRIFVISEVEKNNLLAAGVPPDKIVVNPNGVDADVFRPGLGGRDERESLGIANDTALVGFVGSFGPWHGVLTLAEAIALVPRANNAKFLLVGDGSLRSEVERRLRASGSLDRVIFTGTVAHDRVPVLLDACDILVSPHVPLEGGAEFFGSPTKLFEYMAMGKGIVASRLGQIGDVLDDGLTALLVEPGNSGELCSGICKLATDRELRDRLGKAARVAALEQHTWRRNAGNILESFDSLYE
jgi:glycosyltransferase involved in cell wall biosynthesis